MRDVIASILNWWCSGTVAWSRTTISVAWISSFSRRSRSIVLSAWSSTRVERRIAVAAAIEGAAAARRIGGGELADQHDGGLRRIEGPEGGEETEFVRLARGTQTACGITSGVVSDADTGQHLRHRLADGCVVDEAIVLAVDRQAKAVGIAGLGQQTFRLGRDRTEGVAESGS